MHTVKLVFYGRYKDNSVTVSSFQYRTRDSEQMLEDLEIIQILLKRLTALVKTSQEACKVSLF